MIIYNLPPFLVTKFFYIQLTILISSKESPSSESIDVFIQPLVDELQRLWVGVQAQDFSKPPEHRWFSLRGLLL
jgi:hypothetical protein